MKIKAKRLLNVEKSLNAIAILSHGPGPAVPIRCLDVWQISVFSFDFRSRLSELWSSKKSDLSYLVQWGEDVPGEGFVQFLLLSYVHFNLAVKPCKGLLSRGLMSASVILGRPGVASSQTKRISGEVHPTTEGRVKKEGDLIGRNWPCGHWRDAGRVC